MDTSILDKKLGLDKISDEEKKRRERLGIGIGQITESNLASAVETMNLYTDLDYTIALREEIAKQEAERKAQADNLRAQREIRLQNAQAAVTSNLRGDARRSAESELRNATKEYIAATTQPILPTTSYKAQKLSGTAGDTRLNAIKPTTQQVQTTALTQEKKKLTDENAILYAQISSQRFPEETARKRYNENLDRISSINGQLANIGAPEIPRGAENRQNAIDRKKLKEERQTLSDANALIYAQISGQRIASPTLTQKYNENLKRIGEIDAALGDQNVAQRLEKASESWAMGSAGSYVNTAGYVQDVATRKIKEYKDRLDATVTPGPFGTTTVNEEERRKILSEARAAINANNKHGVTLRNDEDTLRFIEQQAGAAQKILGAADTLQQKSAERMEAAKQGAGKLGQIGLDVYKGMLDLGADAALKTATGMGSALPFMATRVFGSSTQEARQEGATLTQQGLYGLMSAAASVLTEKISNAGDFMTKNYGVGAMDFINAGIVRSVEKLATTEAGKTILNGITTMGLNFLGEGSEEYIESILDNWAKKIYDPTSTNRGSEARRERLMEGFVGGLVGALAGVGGTTDTTDYKAQHTVLDRIGKAVRRGGDEKIEAVIAEGMNGGENTQALARELQGKIASGKTVTDAELGALTAGIATESAAKPQQNAAKPQQTEADEYFTRLGARIKESGELQQAVNDGLAKTGEARTLAQNISDRMARGEEISDADIGRLARATTEAPATDKRIDLKTFDQTQETELERTGRLYGVKEDTIQRAKRLGDLLGRDIVFFSEEANQYGGIVNGEYKKDDGIIRINAKSQNPLAQIISHELTHSLEGTADYTKFMNFVIDRIRETADIDALIEAKQNLYFHNGIELKELGAKKELVAEYVEKNLLTDEGKIRDVVNYSRTVGEFIVGQIDRIRALLGNEDARERVMLDKASRMYHKALEAMASGAPVTETVDAEKAMTREEANELYRTGKMSDEEYEDYHNRHWNAEDDLAGRFSYGGENARNADLGALATAKDMRAAGVSAEDTFRETGWYVGMDGRWRFEIDDSQMRYFPHGDARVRAENPDYAEYQELMSKFLDGSLTSEEYSRLRELDPTWKGQMTLSSYALNNGEATLGDIIRHDELFANYPELADTKIVFSEMADGERGNYNPATNTLTLNESLRDAPEKTIIHEIQHAIQRAEGFTHGASPQYWGLNAEQAPEQIYENALKSLTKEQQNQWLRYQDLNFAMEYGDEANYDRYEAESDELYKKLYNEPWFQKMLDAERAIDNPNSYYNSLYRNTAGEIEARDAADRRTLTADERRLTLPKAGDENTVFAGDGNAAQYSISKTKNMTWEEQTKDYFSKHPSKMGRNDDFYVMDADATLNPLGIGAKPFFMLKRNVNKSMREKGKNSRSAHEIPQNIIEELPQIIKDPALVVIGNGRISIISDKKVRTKDGKTAPILIGVNPNGSVDGVDAYEISSIYGREGFAEWLSQRKDDSKIIVGNTSKASELLRDARKWYPRPVAYSEDLTSEILARGEVVVNASEKNNSTEPLRATLPTADTSGQQSYSEPKKIELPTAEDYRGTVASSELSEEMAQDYNARGEYVDDEIERQARAAGYPILDGKQVVPFKTWVYAEDRDNYGLVVDRNGEELVIEFRNKEAESNGEPGARARKSLPTYLLKPVAGKYSMPMDEWNALMDSEPVEQETYRPSDEEMISFLGMISGDQASTWTPTEREELRAKAQTYVARAENAAARATAKALGVRFDDAAKPVREIMSGYLRTGNLDTNAMDSAFDTLWESGRAYDEQLYNDYKPVRDYLRGQKISVSDNVKSNFADWNEWRKSNMGRLNLANEGGLSVDQAYQELSGMDQNLFPTDIVNPADKLERIAQAAQEVGKNEKSLNDFYGSEANVFKAAAHGDFVSAIEDAAAAARNAARYSERATQEEQKVLKYDTPEKAAQGYKDLKETRLALEKIKAKTLLTDEDRIALGRVLRGESLIDALDPSKYNVADIRKIAKAQQAYDEVANGLREYKKAIKAKLHEEADGYLRDAASWKDKRSGIRYARETAQRNIDDIVSDPKTAAEIKRVYFDSIRKSNADIVKYTNEMNERVKKLDLSRKAAKGNENSEASAVQFLGEAYDNIAYLEGRLKYGKEQTRDGKTLEEWQAAVADFKKANPKMDFDKVNAAVEEFRKIYDEVFTKINETRVRFGYEPMNYRRGYFPHFQSEDDTLFKQIGHALGMDVSDLTLPATINGLTSQFKPGTTWFGHAQERKGFTTAYDALEGFARYLRGATDVIYHTENIQKLRALSDQVRYNASDEGVQKQIDAIRANDTLTDSEKQTLINDRLQEGKYTLGKFVAWLDEYTNGLANKKSKYDRSMEDLIGRKAYTAMKNFNQRVGANMVAANISSATTNFIPLVQAYSRVGTRDMLTGMWQTLANYKTEDGLADRSVFLTNRKGAEPLFQSTFDKVADKAGFLMEGIDQFTSGAIVRARYNQNLRNGMSEDAAMEEADNFAAGIMADRSKGSQPTIFNATNPLFKAFTQFQLEVNNQFSEVFKDLPRQAKQQSIGKTVLMLTKYLIGSYLFNDLFESVFGRRPALDPINMLNEASGDFIGYELPNSIDLVKELIKGEDVSLRTEKKSVGDAIGATATNIAEELPFNSLIGLFVEDFDGGRIPAASAVPNIKNLMTVFDPDASGKYKWKKAGDELMKLLYVAPPFGGNQIQKTAKGIIAAVRGGSYTVNKNGEKILQYPVFRDEGAKTAWQYARMALFGKSATPQAREWVESGFDSFSTKQTMTYMELVKSGMKEREAYEFVEKLSAIKGEDAVKDRVAELRNTKEATDTEKAQAFYNDGATDGLKALMDELDSRGISKSDYIGVIFDLVDETNTTERRYILQKSGLEKEERDLIFDAVSDYKTEIEKKVAKQIEMISSAGLTDQQKLDTFFTYGASDGMRNFIGYLDDQGIDAAKNIDTIFDLALASGKAEKSDVLLSSGMSAKEKREAYKYEIGKLDEDDKAMVALEKISDGAIDSFLRMQTIEGDDKQNRQLDAIKDTKGDDFIALVSSIIEPKMETEKGEPTKYARLISALDSGLSESDAVELYKNEQLTKYAKMSDEGIKSGMAYDITTKLSELDTTAELNTYAEVMKVAKTDQEQFEVMSALVSDPTRLTVLYNNYGVTPKMYYAVKAYVLDKYGEKTSYKQAEYEDAIESLWPSGNLATADAPTTKQKAALWQTLTSASSKTSRKYDFSTAIETQNLLAEAKENAKSEEENIQKSEEKKKAAQSVLGIMLPTA